MLDVPLMAPCRCQECEHFSLLGCKNGTTLQLVSGFLRGLLSSESHVWTMCFEWPAQDLSVASHAAAVALGSQQMAWTSNIDAALQACTQVGRQPDSKCMVGSDLALQMHGIVSGEPV